MNSSPKRIIIIGAGMAGLAAAKLLTAAGKNVIILEARERIGGRIWTDHSFGTPVDLGASFIHGKQKNPIVKLAKEFKAALKPIAFQKSILLIGRDGKNIPAQEVEACELKFKKYLAAISQYAKTLTEDISVAALLKEKVPEKFLENEISIWRDAVYKSYTGADASKISAKRWDQEIVLKGGNYFVLPSYQRIVEGLAKDCKIKFNTKVLTLKIDPHRVHIKTDQGVFLAEAVIVTVPLGVLKKNQITFYPKLPVEKQKAIENIGMGLLNKIIIKFPQLFWPANLHVLGYCADKYYTAPGFANYYPYSQQPILIGFCGGSIGEHLEQFDDATLQQETLQVIRDYFGNNIPEPSEFKVTRWQQDNYAFGSYSYPQVGTTFADYEALQCSIEDKIFFAGEATSAEYFGTTHGAYFSGVRAANEILNLN